MASNYGLTLIDFSSSLNKGNHKCDRIHFADLIPSF